MAIAVAAATAGCASFKPDPDAQAGFLQRTMQREDEHFRVTVAVPSAAETAQIFDRKLYQKGIQPVWLQIENRGDETAYYLPNLLDSDYFAPLEVAYQYHSIWQPKRNTAMEVFFLTNGIRDRISARSTASGFVFTHLDLGRKAVSVSLSDNPSTWHDYRYNFIVDVPGLKADWVPHTWHQLTNGMETIECDDARLREELEKLPRATTDKSGRKEGDPLNLVLIANVEDLASMAGCGWDETERMTSGSAWRTFKSFLFGTEYRYSPVSSLYYARRDQDLALQKARGSVNLRNHLRLWLTPLRYDAKPVWVGQISRDIGVRWTLKTSNLTTHKINPNVDEARGYLIRDLILGQAVKWWGFVKGVGAVSYHEPRRNLTGDPYYTDGLRAVLELSSQTVGPGQVRAKHWEEPPFKTVSAAAAPMNKAGKPVSESAAAPGLVPAAVR